MAGYRQSAEYRPFFTDVMKDVSKSIMGRREQKREQAMLDEKNTLARDAWMGDPRAMQDLVAMDPQLAAQVEDQAMQRSSAQQQKTMAMDTAFSKDLQTVMSQIGAFNTFEEAQAFGQRMTDIMLEKYPERMRGEIPEVFDEQAFKEIKTIADSLPGASKIKTVGSPYQVEHPTTKQPATAILRDDGKGNVYEELMEGPSGSSLTRLSQYDVGLKRQLAEAQATGAEEGKTTEQRAQTAIDAGTAAAVTIPSINRSLALLDQVETSGLKEDIAALQQYVGYEGEETADLSELQQLLASQMFDTLANFTGSISEGELRTARALSTGLGKNTEANKRILRAMQQRLARAIDLARKAATERGDVIALEMLESFDPYAAAPYEGAAKALPPAAATSTPPAPPAALEKLRADPSLIDAFVEQFGYRPEGF